LSSDPYQLLGVERTASQADIQKAYRKLAKKLHPDLNPGDKGAEDRFKDVSGAYDLLGDPEKRARFDRGEIDASGAERPERRFYRDYAGGAEHAYASDAGYADMAGMDDVLSELFGRARRANVRARGRDQHYHLQLDFLDAINGGKRQMTLPDGSVLDVSIPPGTRDGQVLRLRGKGAAGLGGGPPGDALVEISMRRHHMLTRKGNDIHVEVPVPLRVAVLGGKITVPTTTGDVAVTVPKWSNTGRVLRLRGKGVPRPDGTRGDEYVSLKIVLPGKPDAELQTFIEQWRPAVSDGARQTTDA
jgi:DnaJ-class molecular chaperone